MISATSGGRVGVPHRARSMRPPKSGARLRRAIGSVERTRLRSLIEKHAIVRSGASARIGRPLVGGNWLLDIRSVFLLPEALDIIATEFWTRYGRYAPCQIAGLELGAIPLIGALLAKAAELGIDANGLLIRKSRNKKGLLKTVEGSVLQRPTIVVDDLVNSGSSLDRVRLVLADCGVVVGDAFVIVDFKAQEGIEWRERHRVEIQSMFRLDELGLRRRSLESPAEARLGSFEPVWEYRFERPSALELIAPRSVPVCVGDLAIFGTTAGALVAVSLTDGEEVWRHQTAAVSSKGILSSPAHADGRIYFGAYDGDLYALNASDGAVVWRSHCAEFVGSSPLLAPDLGRLFVGVQHQLEGRKGGLAAFSLDTGDRIWETPTVEYLHASPVLARSGGLLVVGTNDCDVLAARADDGRVVWRTKIGGPVKVAGAVDELRGLVVIVAMDGRIYGLDLRTGTVAFVYATGSAVYAEPLIVGRRLFAPSTDKCLHVVDLDSGSPIARLSSRARSFCGPALIEDGVVFGNNAGLIFDLDPVSLAMRARHQVPDRVAARIVYDGARGLYLSHTLEDRLFAFRRAPCRGDSG